MFKLTLFILALNIFSNKAAVIKLLHKETTDVMESTTASIDILTTTLQPEHTTIKEEDHTITSLEVFGALSRDEEATIIIVDQTLLNSELAELIKTEAQTIDLNKSAKLLLLSTPKIAEKPKQPEENLEDSEEENEMEENVTQIIIETTTMPSTDEDTTTNINILGEVIAKNYLEIKDQIDSSSTAKKITKLYPINDTLYAENNKIVKCETEESPATIVQVQPKESLNSNLYSDVMQEPELDYVLLESEVLQGSYTDIDSELHLQPIVESVEIVPSSLDDTQFINYFQSW